MLAMYSALLDNLIVTEDDKKAARLHETQAFSRTLHVIESMIRARLLVVI
jgi:hypothetical protein